ncbi:MAG: hypothetical protein SOX68_06430 [Faecalicoccus sp.]|uniref:hypothetical protein n=1 Tax=Faecalicoccus sp. TaxID=1971758 RepID=UPI002A8150C6|nr:hypothetical protein [Faecalicoccus sp.]MDY4278575.1 hypothetical protein [Faecalicoccus sp.]
MNIVSIVLLIVLIFLSFLIPIFLRRHVWKKLSLAIDQEDFNDYFKTLDSFMSKLSFPAYYRENIRLSAYITQNKESMVKKQVRFMIEEMNLKPEEKIQVLEKAFYYFMDKKDGKEAFDILCKIQAMNSKKYDSMKIEYEILIEKKANYIDELKKQIERIEINKGKVGQEEQNIIIGYYKYLIGLQYGYLQNNGEKKRFLSEALKLCEGTGYENQIKKQI